jgi:hypothetical protein
MLGCLTDFEIAMDGQKCFVLGTPCELVVIILEEKNGHDLGIDEATSRAYIMDTMWA